MTKEIKNENNSMIYCYTDKNNVLQSAKISNYSLNGLVTLKEISNTKNSYKITEKLALWLPKSMNHITVTLKLSKAEMRLL